jgi:hypothetical protein
MSYAADASAEIDRLVWGIGGRLGEKHGAPLQAMARDVELDSIELLPQFAGFLLDGLLTDEVATLRLRYADPGVVSGRLAELNSRGLAEKEAGAWRATARLRPLLKAIRSEVADVAFEKWGGHDVNVSIVTEAARSLREVINERQIVAAVHAKVKAPIDRYALLEQRLVTLRYMRQQDHADAWLDRGLSAPEIVILTALWRAEEVDAAEEPLESLRRAELVSADALELTAQGRTVRAAIEDDTNVRTQRSFDHMDEAVAARFLDGLRALPA